MKNIFTTPFNALKKILNTLQTNSEDVVIDATSNTDSSQNYSFTYGPGNTMKSLLSKLGKTLAIIFIAIVIFSGFVIIRPGNRGVKTTFGKVDPTVYNEGLHFKIPLVQRMTSMNVRVQKNESVARSASKDLQSVQTDMALNYNYMPESIVTLYQNIGSERTIETKIIDPAIQESVKAATANFNAEQLISERSSVNEMITQNLKNKLGNLGINVVAVNIVDFKFSEAFDRAIEEKVTAEQQALTSKNKLEQIKFEAQQKVETAKGEAESILLRAQAEAEANVVVAKSLTESLVKYKGIEKRNGTLPKVTSEAGVILQGEF